MKNTLKKLRRGVIYARYSSHNQRDASIEQQVEECRTFAAEAGITVIDVYADRAVSGKSDQRPAFQKLMKDAAKGEFDVVIAWKSNRIGRNMMQAMVNEARLDECGVKCLYTEEDFDDTAAGRFALRSMMNVNQFYSENMAEDIIRGLQDNASKCMVNGKLPFGYKKAADGKYAIDDEAASIVREIFTKVACGTTQTEIAESLNMRGIKTANNGKFGKNSFDKILHNDRYRGVYIYGNTRIEGGVPRIISDDLFYRVQAVLARKANPQNNSSRKGCSDYMLTGKVYCGICGQRMVGTSGHSSHGDRELYYYYICNNRRLNHACPKSIVRRDVLERTVTQAIKDVALQDHVIEWIADQTVAYFDKLEQQSDVALIQSQIDAVSRSINNVLQAIEKGIITDTTKDRLLALEAENADLHIKLETAKANIFHISRDKIIVGLQLFKIGNFEDQKFLQSLFDTFLSRVDVYEDNVKITFSYSGNENSTTLPMQDCATSGSYEPPLVEISVQPTNHSITMIGNMFYFFYPILK